MDFIHALRWLPTPQRWFVEFSHEFQYWLQAFAYLTNILDNSGHVEDKAGTVLHLGGGTSLCKREHGLGLWVVLEHPEKTTVAFKADKRNKKKKKCYVAQITLLQLPHNHVAEKVLQTELK